MGIRFLRHGVHTGVVACMTRVTKPSGGHLGGRGAGAGRGQRLMGTGVGGFGTQKSAARKKRSLQFLPHPPEPPEIRDVEIKRSDGGVNK